LSAGKKLVRLSLSQLTLADAHPRQLIDAAEAIGFDAVCLRVVPPMRTDKIVEIAGQEALIKDIAGRLDATGLRVLDVDAVWLTAHTDVKTLEPPLEVAARLGAQHVLAVGDDPDLGRLTENFSALCD
jgi:sugar phosphate isomerase/epimerase